MNQFILKLRILLLQNKLYVLLFFLSSIFALLFTNFLSFSSKYNNNSKEFVVRITDIFVDGNKLSLEVKGKEKLIGSLYFDTFEEKNDFINSYNIGDEVLIKGILIKPKYNTIPNTFNYKKYLYYNKIYYLIEINDIKKLNNNKNIFYKIKNYVYRRLEKISNNKYLYTFIVGEKKHLENHINETYKNNGISHLFALSGMHVSVLSGVIIFILKKIKIKELLRCIITFSFLILFSFVSGFSPSIIRASLFFFLLGLNKIYYFYIKSSNLLLLTYTILVIINPFIIYSLSFILSFTITFFILIFYEQRNKENYFKSLLLTSIVSFFSSFGIIIYNYYEINIFSILFNLFFVPYVSFTIYPFSLITFIFPKLTNIFLFLTNIMEYVSFLFNKIKIGNIIISKVNILYLVLYYLLLYTIIKYKKAKYVIFIILLNLFYYLLPFFDSKTYVYFLDVGQGDSIFIKTPYNKNNIIIDTGGKVTYFEEEWEKKTNTFSLSNTLSMFYKSVGAKKIDYMFITHGDEDHIGYGINLHKYISITNIFINKGNINDYEKSLNNYKIYNKDLFKIDNINIYSLNNKIYDNENDNSLIFLLNIESYKILLMGDASKEQERYIIGNYNLKNTDFLKVGHHGSKTSSDNIFIKTINPKYSIISVGENNRFGHPNKTTLDLLNKYKSKIYRTDIDGSIIITIKNNRYNISSTNKYNKK